MRADGRFSAESMDALEDLYNQLVNDQFALEYHLMSPTHEDRCKSDRNTVLGPSRERAFRGL